MSAHQYHPYLADPEAGVGTAAVAAEYALAAALLENFECAMVYVPRILSYRSSGIRLAADSVQAYATCSYREN